jgi:hypothetical protein
MVAELLLDAIRVGIWQIDLIDRHHNWHIGGPRMRNGLNGLRHHPIVGCHNQDDDIGCLCPAGTHGGEGFVARGIEEDNVASRGVHRIGADMLRDATGLALRDIGGTDSV